MRKIMNNENDGPVQPEIVCARCQPLEALIGDYESKLVELGQECQRLEDELAGRERQLRREGATVVALQRELRQVREDEPGSDEVRHLLKVWMDATGRGRKGRKPNIDVSSKRGQLVKKALRMVNANTGERYTVAELELAFIGLGLLPYVVSGVGRRPVGTSKERYDDVEHALRDEKTIDTWIGRARRAAGQASVQAEGIWQGWQRVQALERQWARLALDACAAVERGVQGEDLEALLLSRSVESDRRWAEILADLEEPVERPGLRAVA